MGLELLHPLGLGPVSRRTRPPLPSAHHPQARPGPMDRLTQPSHTTRKLSLSLALRPAHPTRSASPPLDPARPGPARTLSLPRLSGPSSHGT